MDHVDRTLALWRSTPFQWGQSDCMLSVGDYLASRGWHDVTGLFRGLYDTEAEALGHMQAQGGVAGLVDLTGVPSVEPAQAVRGDVVCFDTGDVQVGALCTGSGIAARLHRGVVEVDRRLVRIVAAWRVDNVGSR